MTICRQRRLIDYAFIEPISRVVTLGATPAVLKARPAQPRQSLRIRDMEWRVQSRLYKRYSAV